MQALDVKGAAIHYADEGDRGGTPVVFSNSLGTDFRIWDDMIARLGPRLRIIRYDTRGHGLSDTPSDACTVEELADDLAALLDHLEVTRAVIVGLSIGGLVAQALAARRPDLVRALVLMDTAARIGEPMSWESRIAQVEAEGVASIADGVISKWFSAGFRAHRRTELAAWRAMLSRTESRGYAACCRALRDADLRESTARISVPVLAICGDEDGATPPAVVEATADLIAGARFELVREAGHLPCIEHPNTCAAMLTAFLSEIG
ncbi:MAG: 3-oxoadipate enol-lactonase [Rhodobacteraceae bacterium]|nr:3-oxoadipate enol-lactonase [Paracoccaceae bacterium]